MTYQRDRERGSIQDLYWDSNTHYLYCNGTTSDVPARNLVGRTGFKENMRDIVTPGFEKLRRQGVVVIHPVNQWSEYESHSIGGQATTTYLPTCTSGTKSITYNSAISAPLLVPPLSEDALDNLAILAGTQAAANVEPATVTALVELAELSKTLALLRNPLSELKRLMKRLRSAWRRHRRQKGKPRTDGKPYVAYSFTEFVMNEWLVYRYGILPLCFTIDGILQNLVGDAFVPPRFTARGSSTSGYSESYTTPAGTGPMRISVQSLTCKYSVRAGLLYEHTFSTGLNKWGTTFADVPSAIWELIPYSFVVDWFVNVGDYIRAITPKAGVRILGSWTVRKEETESKCESTRIPEPNSVTFSYTDSRYHNATRRTMTKVRSHGISVGLAFQDISFAKRKDWLHLADGFALLGSKAFR